MLTRAQARAQRRAIQRDIAKAQRRQAKEHLAHLRAEIRAARAHHKEARRQAVMRCRAERVGVRARLKHLRKKLLEDMRLALLAERDAARSRCTASLGDARRLKDVHARARAELEAERQFRRELRLIEAGNRKRQAEHRRASRAERRQESDDEVRANIPPELVGLFNKVRRQIKGSDRMSRAEAFLHYAEEHPGEVLVALEDRTEEVIRDLERQYAAGRRSLAGPPSTEGDLPPF